jgi:hypothetical protein
MHHICFESDDVDAELEGARAKGIPLIDEKPRLGLAGMICFLHPKANHGVLVEFATPSRRPQPMSIGATHIDHMLSSNDMPRRRSSSENFGFPIRTRVAGRGRPQVRSREVVLESPGPAK